ncbi:MAG: hypothetical protein H6831_00470 [Planctomycetes bacterium]|nr:hypothetical protein [Planctomycetota bacterium]MCB9902857.1 hypothetical protein [Planctomycetota bacterium]
MTDPTPNDATAMERPAAAGTRIELDAASTAPIEDTFAPYTHDFRFDTTRCTLRLYEYGTSFLSRSEAKRLVTDLELPTLLARPSLLAHFTP